MARVPLVTVSIPAWRSADTIHATVSSVLAQTVDDIQVIVTSDGDDLDALDSLSDIMDQRLILRRSDRNVGRYAIDHDIVQSCRSRWWTVCDSDDYVEPDWLESMLRVASHTVDVVVCPHVQHDLQGRDGIYPVQPYIPGEFNWIAHMGACLWSVDWMRQVGATTPDARVGWDSMMVQMAFMLGRTVVSDDARYHRVRRQGSLTTDPMTGMRSTHRLETARRIRAVWQDIAESPDRSREIVASMAYDRRLMLSSDALPTTNWSMTPAALIELEAYLYRAQPRTILEMGSGLSTVVLAHYARSTGAQVTTLEHDARYFNETRKLLSQHGVLDSVSLESAHLYGTPPVYGHAVSDGVDFCVIDGPPERLGGRAATLPHVLPHLADRWVAWLDDGDRDGEMQAVRRWKSDHAVQARQTAIPRGVTLVSQRPMRRHKIDATGVVLCILTGWRPHLLRQTLASLPAGLLRSAYVIVCHDGGDDDTRRVLEKYEKDIDILHIKTHDDRQMDTIGVNWSALASEAVEHGAYMMMLEDDWQYITEEQSWIQSAIGALADPDIAQVRLRHLSDRVRPRHMITGESTRWTPHQYGLISDTHFTFNPSLMRTADIHRIFPCDGEIQAQTRAMTEDMRCVVQLVPGVFTHLAGDDDSMRVRLSPPR